MVTNVKQCEVRKEALGKCDIRTSREVRARAAGAVWVRFSQEGGISDQVQREAGDAKRMKL